MPTNTLIVSGSSGLIGSHAVEYFDALGWRCNGIDNNMRRDFFGPDGDTTWNRDRLLKRIRNYRHHSLDIRDRNAVLAFFSQNRADLVVHAAAQPSHDLSRDRPFDDFDVNAVGTMNLLEATRRHCPAAVFCFLSTNKVYGDSPNRLPLVELETRWDYLRPEDRHGIAESCPLDQSLHTVFGASKVAADVMVQEYGRSFGMRTGVFRGGCLTGPNHSAAQLHGFLAYIVRAAIERRQYTVFGYKGKQVRDNIHASDVCSAIHEFFQTPRCGEVYNIGGARDNSVSVIEAISMVEAIVGRKMDVAYSEENRMGDHICYITDLRKLRSHFPNWQIAFPLRRILEEMVHVRESL